MREGEDKKRQGEPKGEKPSKRVLGFTKLKQGTRHTGGAPDLGRTNLPIHGGLGALVSSSEFPASIATPKTHTLWNNLPILESEGRLITVNSNHLFSKIRVQRI